MLENPSVADLEPSWGVAIGDRSKSHDKRAQVGFLSRDSERPHLDLMTYSDPSRSYVRGIDLVLPNDGEVEALVAAWGEPEHTGTHSHRPGRAPNTNKEGHWYPQPATTQTWWTADRSQMATLWTPTEEGLFPPRLTVRRWADPAEVVKGLSTCSVFGLVRGASQGDDMKWLDNVNGGRFRAPSVTPIDLNPMVLIDDPNYVSRLHGLTWNVRDDGSFLPAAQKALASMPSGKCDDGVYVGLTPSSPSSPAASVSIKKQSAPPKPTGTPEQQEALAAASRQALVMGCITMGSDALELVFSVRDGRAANLKVLEVQTSFSNVPVPRKERNDVEAKCVRDKAETWTFREGLVADDVKMLFTTTP